MAYRKKIPTFKYAQYAGQDSNYVPGEVYRSGFSSSQYTPQEMIDYRINQLWDFPLQKNPDQSLSFQSFLNLSNNPSSLIGTKLMNIPSGFLSGMNIG